MNDGIELPEDCYINEKSVALCPKCSSTVMLKTQILNPRLKPLRTPKRISAICSNRECSFNLYGNAKQEEKINKK